MYAYSDSRHLQCPYNGVPNQVNQGVEKDWHKIPTEKTVILDGISLVRMVQKLIFQNSLTTVGYLLGVFFRLWIPF